MAYITVLVGVSSSCANHWSPIAVGTSGFGIAYSEVFRRRLAIEVNSPNGCENSLGSPSSNGIQSVASKILKLA